MKHYSYEFDWQRMQGGVALAPFSTVTGSTTTFATSCLPAGHQKMRGLQAAYWSGYSASTNVVDGVTGIGEIVLVRADGATWKAYNYPIGCSGEQTFVGAEFKDFFGHHFSSGTPVPLNNVFGNIPWPCRIDGVQG